MKKKWAKNAFLAMSLALTCQNVSAAGFDDSNLCESEDYAEVLQLDSKFRNYRYSTYNGEDSLYAEKEVAYEKPIKVYMGISIYEDKDITADEIRDALKNYTDYQWIIPVYYCGETGMVFVKRAEELSLEEIEFIEKGIEDGIFPEDEDD